MRVLLTILIVALLASSVDAQVVPRKLRSNKPPESELQKKQKRDADKAYKSSLEKMPDKKYDPWAKVR